MDITIGVIIGSLLGGLLGFIISKQLSVIVFVDNCLITDFFCLWEYAFRRKEILFPVKSVP